MHTHFALQQPVGVLAIYFERDRFDARAFTFQAIRDHGLESVALRPAQIHAQQHLRPVLAFGTARAGMNGDDGIAGVVGARQQHLGFEFFEMRSEGADFPFDVAVDGFAFARQLEQGFNVGGQAGDALVLIDLLLNALAVLHDFLAFFGLRPEIRSVGLFF